MKRGFYNFIIKLIKLLNAFIVFLVNFLLQKSLDLVLFIALGNRMRVVVGKLYGALIFPESAIDQIEHVRNVICL